MTSTPLPANTQFDGSTQYRKAFSYIARRGRVVIGNGTVTLFNHAGEQIETAPVATFTVNRPWWTMGNGCYATFASGKKYNLTLRSMGATAATEALGGELAATVLGRKATKRFMEALDEARAATSSTATA